jgi:hypothetical protein
VTAAQSETLWCSPVIRFGSLLSGWMSSQARERSGGEIRCIWACGVDLKKEKAQEGIGHRQNLNEFADANGLLGRQKP